MSDAWRLLREHWRWWLVPLLLTLLIGVALALSVPNPEPVMPLHYDLPNAPPR